MIFEWSEELASALTKKYGESSGSDLFNRYQSSFPLSYHEKNTTKHAIYDIAKLEKLTKEDNISVELYGRKSDEEGVLHLKFFQMKHPVPLSDILPILENLGLLTISEECYKIKTSDEAHFSISDFTVENGRIHVKELSTIKEMFEQSLINLMKCNAENDGFNKLIMAGGLSSQQVNILRAYAKYLKQIKYRYSQRYIEKTLYDHIDITKILLDLFNSWHQPNDCEKLSEQRKVIEESIYKRLEQVKLIDDDNIIRQYILLIKSTLRTNFFQKQADDKEKKYITFKINSSVIPDLPLPKPLIDTFIYSYLFEGIHLRSDKVSRGGIRLSDRHDDYRTEVLGLMKAQKVKNAIIIPSGAKGGFIIKKPAIKLYKNDTKQAIVYCYQQFIRGLLDITDNINCKIVCKPTNVVCHDEEDTYFVVAADKGTSDLSDYANSISEEYHFWMGDAFASGGSNGYDHKKLGITAHGAWESIKRSMQELDLINPEISVVGIGDMSGDVFGNGMIYSDKIRLVAAFDHRHIFLDPNPDISFAYKERKRLFNMAASSWSDYNKKLISSGGGVYSRSEKTIKISNSAKHILDISEDELTPDRLIKAILKAPVDLLYNGGIGTYVKASHETSADVGDKSNEFCRVNGNELRCKMVCEGGNLGFTQLARVEYALNGGKINTDFIDNSAGVDCSDHEVNIKILLNSMMGDKNLSQDVRNTLLADMQNEVSKLVLQDNYSQALVMSYSAAHAFDYIDLYRDHIKQLEEVANLDRSLEGLPSDIELNNRKSMSHGLTKPELAILLAYTKIYVKSEILKSTLPDQFFFHSYLYKAFPSTLIKHCMEEINNHPLKREVIATQISNNILNKMGITFPFRLQKETGASISDVAIANMLSEVVFKADELHDFIHSLDNSIPVDLQYELLHLVRMLLNMSTRWFIRNSRINNDLSTIAEYYSHSIDKLCGIIPNLILGTTKEYITKVTNSFINAGLPTDKAERIAISRVMYTALNIAEVASIHDFDIVKTAKLYFHVGGAFNLVWFRDLIASDNRPGKLSNAARLSLRDDLDQLQRRMTIVIMQSDVKEDDVVKLTDNWIRDNNNIYHRWMDIVKNCEESQEDDYAVFFISLRELQYMINQKANDEKISLLAYHDSLTKLPNRFSIADKIEKLKTHAMEEEKTFAVHFIDLDNFKYINDTYGHDFGDKLLVALTKRISASIRSDDMVARLGGDEFLVLQSSVHHNFDAENLANNLLNLIKQPFNIEEYRVILSASIGISIYDRNNPNHLELLSNADKAMYEAKEKGKGTVSIT
jgi:glutamate dehydrogenase